MLNYSVAELRLILLIICLIFVNKSNNFSFSVLSIPSMKIGIMLLLPLPIIVQIIINWLYSSACNFLITNKLVEEGQKYRQTIDCIKNKNSEDIPVEYSRVTNKVLIARDSSSDTDLTAINELLYDRLDNICKIPSFFPMLCSYFKTRYKKLSTLEENEVANCAIEIVNALEDENTSVLEGSSDSEILKAVETYEKMKNRNSISAFCKQNKIDENKFKECRKRYINNTNGSKKES